MKDRLRRAFAASLLLSFVLQVDPVAAESGQQSPLDGKLQIRLGAFWPSLDSGLSIETERGPGSRLDLERDLGLDEAKTTIYGGLSWRFSPRHTLEMEYFDLGRSGRRSAEREWEIGNSTALLGATMDAELDLRMTRFTYHYALVSSERHRFALSGGIHYLRLEAEIALSGELLLNGRPIFVQPETPVTEVDRTEAPLPHFGFQYGYALGESWTAHFNLIGFDVEIDKADGRLLEINAGAQYRINKYIGLGAGLKYFDLDVDHERKKRTTTYDFDFVGPAVYLTATF